jgi:quercetin 2,3-dioxygenase
MDRTRAIHKIAISRPVTEGAGVHLRRAFGFGPTPLLDPFLLLDDFRSKEPRDYVRGFPWHPHRGIETISYVLEGQVEHGDSLGNSGVIGPGDVQWMTAGSGIVHQEMPKGDARGQMGGFQLWANLPASHKMMHPRYQDIKSTQIPTVSLPNGATIRVICGEVEGVAGPVRDIVTEPQYLDVTMPPSSQVTLPTTAGHTVLTYVIDGRANFCPGQARDTYEVDGEPDVACETLWENGSLIVFSDGDQIVVSTEADPVRFLLMSGKPIREPVAWYGPIVMNTEEELQVAFDEYRNGTFLKHQPA